MTAPRPAASVVVARDSATGMEVLMVQRGRGASFMANAWVFPGGRVDDSDGPVSERASFAAAAVRELAEEAAIRLDAAGLRAFARWITPSAEPRRFDALFFLTAAPLDPADQAARPDAGETVASRWDRPAVLMAEHEAGTLRLPPPTFAMLEDLSAFPSVSAALAWAEAQPIEPILPKLVALSDEGISGGRPAILLPWDPDYASHPGEGEPWPAEHPLARVRTRFVF